MMRVAGLVLAVAMAWPAMGWGYAIRGSRWHRSDLPVTYEIHRSLAPNLDDLEVREALQKGFDHWEDVECSDLKVHYDGRTENADWGVNDGQNIVSWRVRSWPESRSAIAVTATLASHSQRVLDSDIIFNEVHFDFDLNGARGKMDIEAVATHEAGHVMGLDHSLEEEATMFPTTGNSNLDPRSLHDDDKAGLCAIYPKDGAEGFEDVGRACGQAGCPDDMLCQDEEEGDPYCTKLCEWRHDCPEGTFCVKEFQKAAICLRFEGEDIPGAEIGDPCGARRLCQLGLDCIRESGEFYCSGSCGPQGDGLVRLVCPEGYWCKTQRDGSDACSFGEDPETAEPDPWADAGDSEDPADAGTVEAPSAEPQEPPEPAVKDNSLCSQWAGLPWMGWVLGARR